MKKTPKKLQKKYNCCPCSFASNNLNDFNRHNSTTKHERTINAIFGLTKKTPTNHKCKFCDKKYKHCSSLSKHSKNCKKQKGVLSKVIQSYPKVIHHKFVCGCKKSYKFASGLSKHKKTCEYNPDHTNKNNTNESIHIKLDNISAQNKALFVENKILKEQILNLKLGTTINNENNLTINMFLNDKCKNAMNLEDFVEKIKFTLEDLKYTADNGFTDGISNVFIKNLNGLDVTERPIHCTDQKRLQFYVKNEDVWEKDDVNLTNSIEQMSKKQGSSINEWTHANPNYLKSEKKRDEYFKIVNETMKSTDCKNIKNIKKNVSRNVKLEKKDM
jgi:hypothetical protein